MQSKYICGGVDWIALYIYTQRGDFNSDSTESYLNTYMYISVVHSLFRPNISQMYPPPKKVKLDLK